MNSSQPPASEVPRPRLQRPDPHADPAGVDARIAVPPLVAERGPRPDTARAQCRAMGRCWFVNDLLFGAQIGRAVHSCGSAGAAVALSWGVAGGWRCDGDLVGHATVWP